MSTDVMKRPVGVTIVSILIVIAGVFNIVLGSVLFFAAFGENPTYVNHLGQEETVSTFYLWFNGALMILLGFIFFWLAGLAWRGSATAQMLISVLATINIIFGFFHLGAGGWGQILINLAILLIVNTARAKIWFSQQP